MVLPRVVVLSSLRGAGRRAADASEERFLAAPRGDGDLVRPSRNRSTGLCGARVHDSVDVMRPPGGFCLGGAGAVSKLPHSTESLLDLGAECQRVKAAVQRVESVALVGRENARGEQALIRRLRPIIVLR